MKDVTVQKELNSSGKSEISRISFVKMANVELKAAFEDAKNKWEASKHGPTATYWYGMVEAYEMEIANRETGDLKDAEHFT